jgi:4'-phosphopantetheinyl transferase
MRWLARGEHEVPDDDSWLAAPEAARLARYRYTKRRTEYRLRRWTGKQAVAAVAGFDAGTDPSSLARIEVLNRPTGAPYVLVDGEPLGVDVSLTDRAGWAVCLVGEPGGAADVPAASVGVDLELVEPRSHGFVSDFLTEAEQAVVRSAPPGTERFALANLMWSAKESALKVLRTGLRADTRTVDVRLGDLGSSRRDDGWAPLEVEVRPHPDGTGRAVDAWIAEWTRDHRRVLPGWWRRDGVFVLTVVYAEPAQPPRLLADATADLAVAVPVHTWLANPLP